MSSSIINAFVRSFSGKAKQPYAAKPALRRSVKKRAVKSKPRRR